MNTCPYCLHQTTGTHCSNCGAVLAGVNSTQASSNTKPVDDVALPPGSMLNFKTMRVLGMLGRGGFGITYKALETKTGRTLAVKESFPDGMVTRNPDGKVRAVPGHEQDFLEAKKHFANETKILSQLQNRGATKFFQIWQENGTAYMALELLNGETLEERISRGQKLSEAEAVYVLQGVLNVLQELHSKKLLHRDIKPANIMLAKNIYDRHVELIDFGSVTSFEHGKRVRVATRFVTPEYAPLEQYAEEALLGPATDFYALGATLFEATTLNAPPPTLQRAKSTVFTPVHKLNPDISLGFSAVIAYMMNMKLSVRPESVKALRKMVSDVEGKLDAYDILLAMRVIGRPKTFGSLLQWLRLGFVYVSRSMREAIESAPQEISGFVGLGFILAALLFVIVLGLIFHGI